jgi:hypothetical protein
MCDNWLKSNLVVSLKRVQKVMYVCQLYEPIRIRQPARLLEQFAVHSKQ